MNLQKTIDLLEDLNSGKLPHPFVVEEHIEFLNKLKQRELLKEIIKEDENLGL